MSRKHKCSPMYFAAPHGILLRLPDPSAVCRRYVTSLEQFGLKACEASVGSVQRTPPCSCIFVGRGGGREKRCSHRCLGLRHRALASLALPTLADRWGQGPERIAAHVWGLRFAFLLD